MDSQSRIYLQRGGGDETTGTNVFQCGRMGKLLGLLYFDSMDR